MSPGHNLLWVSRRVSWLRPNRQNDRQDAQVDETCVVLLAGAANAKELSAHGRQDEALHELEREVRHGVGEGEADFKVVERARAATGEENRKPGDDDAADGRNLQEDEHDDVRYRQQPLDQRQPAVKPGCGVGVLNRQADGLFVVGRIVPVAVNIEYVVYGPNVDEAGVRRAVELSQDKCCGVSAMLRKPCPVNSPSVPSKPDRIPARSRSTGGRRRWLTILGTGPIMKCSKQGRPTVSAVRPASPRSGAARAAP